MTLALFDVDGNRIENSATPQGVDGVVMTFICSVSAAVRVALVVLSIGLAAGIYLGALVTQG